MSTFLDEKEVSLVILSLELEQAVLEHTLVDNQKIFVTESGVFPFWLQMYPESHILSFSTFVDLDPAMSMAERYAFCNRVNSASLVHSVYVHENCLYTDYAISYRDGLMRSQFIRTCRQFADGAENVRQKLAAFSEGTYADDDQQ